MKSPMPHGIGDSSSNLSANYPYMNQISSLFFHFGRLKARDISAICSVLMPSGSKPMAQALI